MRRERISTMVGGGGSGEAGGEICEGEERIYFTSIDLIVDNIDGEEDHGDGDGDSKTELTHSGDL